MVSREGEVLSIIPEDLLAVWHDVIWWTFLGSFGGADSINLGIDYHLTVSGDICCNVSITALAIVFPAATNVQEVELALWTSTFLHIHCYFNLEVWGFW